MALHDSKSLHQPHQGRSPFYRMRDSNPQPLAQKANALSFELMRLYKGSVQRPIDLATLDGHQRNSTRQSESRVLLALRWEAGMRQDERFHHRIKPETEARPSSLGIRKQGYVVIRQIIRRSLALRPDRPPEFRVLEDTRPERVVGITLAAKNAPFPRKMFPQRVIRTPDPLSYNQPRYHCAT
jgi:hypothetical protein